MACAAMLVISKDHEAQLRNLIAGYGDSIRLSDIKANIAVLFVAIMMGTVLQFRNQYPHYLNVPVLLVEALPVRCALLSRILYWKNITLQTAYLVSIGTLAAAGVLLFVNW